MDPNALSGLGEALVEALRVKRLGPGYRQKQELLDQQVAGGQMKLDQETKRAPIELAVLEEQLKQTSAGRKKNEIDLSRVEDELKRKAEIESIMQRSTGGKSVEELAAEDALYGRGQKRKVDQAELDKILSEIRENNAQAANPGGQGGMGGGYAWGVPPGETEARIGMKSQMEREGWKQSPTADQRNQERYDVTIPVAFEELQDALTDVKHFAGMKALTSPIQAGMSRSEYKRLARALSATVGRALGDNRITDADRPIYTNLLAVANDLIVTDPGTEMAQRLLNRSKSLFKRMADARKAAQRNQRPMGGVGAPAVGDDMSTDVVEEYERDENGKLVRVR